MVTAGENPVKSDEPGSRDGAGRRLEHEGVAADWFEWGNGVRAHHRPSPRRWIRAMGKRR
jgi:hypothetical protein